MAATPVFPPSLDFSPRYVNPSGLNTWVEHLPFAFDLVQSLRPAVVVELGTYYGESFFGFCQSVAESGLDCLCYAVDTWRGDQHAGLYGEDVYETVVAYQRENYAAFSNLLRNTFDEALSRFEDETISLLHIDGLHTFEAVSHDFDSWFPKVRPGGVILLHDIAVRREGFGVWRFWDSLQRRLPNFAFHHGNGLGIVQKPGAAQDNDLLSTLLCAGPDLQNHARRYYSMCGQQLLTQAQLQPKHALVRLYWPDSGAYSEERSVYAHIRLNVWEELCFRVPTTAAGPLRLDPADSPGVIELSELAIVSTSRPEPLWTLDASSMAAVRSCGTAIRIPSEKHLTILSVGQDPQLLLPELPAITEGLAVRGRIRVRTDPDAASGMVQSLIDAFRNQETPEATRDLVRTAVAHPRSAAFVLEEFGSRIELLQKQLVLSGSELQEQKRQAADSENRRQIAVSEAAHYQNLLEEQRRQAANSENRLQIAVSEAAHYQNLLEEQRRQAADSENRRQIAVSEAEHYQNLLEEQRQQAADSENRRQIAVSEAEHYHNLLEEQRQQAADSENRRQIAVSEAAHYQNLLEEQRRRAADSENRLQIAVSEAAHYQNLLEEQRQ